MSDSCQGQVGVRVLGITWSFQEAVLNLRFLLRFCPLPSPISCTRACPVLCDGVWKGGGTFLFT